MPCRVAVENTTSSSLIVSMFRRMIPPPCQMRRFDTPSITASRRVFMPVAIRSPLRESRTVAHIDQPWPSFQFRTHPTFTPSMAT